MEARDTDKLDLNDAWDSTWQRSDRLGIERNQIE